MVTLLGGEALVLALGHSDPGLVSYPTPFMLMATKMAYADVPLPPALHHARRSVGPPPCSTHPRPKGGVRGLQPLFVGWFNWITVAAP